MGRRPNAIVSEYFERGKKLTDSSNRYSHTCKRCGEVFPKGRVDSLMSHLLRRCPNIGQEDRQGIYQAIQQSTPSVQQSVSNQGEQLQGSPPNPFVDFRSDIPLSFLPPREQSALDTLAEVSRLAGTDQGEQPPTNEIGQGFEEQALMMQLQNAANMPTFPYTSNEEAMAMYVPNDMPAVSQPVETTITAPLASSPLVQTASAANEQLEHASAHNQPNIQPDQGLDPHLGDIAAEAHEHIVPHKPEVQPEMSWNQTSASGVATFGNMSSPMVVSESSPTGFGLLQRSSKNKARGRFSDVRRKEVQEIRKRGACIRCRMLKKSCSEGTPCSTCKSVESARLWKSACLRTRLADEFTLWSTGLFHSKAKIEVPGAVHGLNQQGMKGRIEVKFFAGSNLGMTFYTRKYNPGLVKYKSTMDEENVNPEQDDASHQSNVTKDSSDDIWLLAEGEGMSTKIEEYVNQIADACVGEEDSAFLKTTLQRAQEMIETDEADSGSWLESSATRSCYTLQSELVKNTVELWVETVVLTSPKLNGFQVRYNSKDKPSGQPVEIQWKTDNEKHTPTSLPLRSQQLILAQLLAATESRCVGLSKTIMNELERRLLQRAQVSRFATFISAVILLNCIERMTGVYRSFDPDTSPPKPQTTNEHAQDTIMSDSHAPEEEPTPFQRPPNWPLDDLPRKLWLQGEHFADLLIMLLRMRNLPPKTSTTTDRKLIVSQDQSSTVTINRSVKEQTDDQTKVPAAWLNPLELKESELLRIRDGAPPSKEQGVRGWDMKFISKVLLPETAK